MKPDGYEAVQLGFRDKPRRLARRSERGHVAKLDSKRVKSRTTAGVEIPAKADCEPQRFIREFRTPVEGFKIGQKITVDIFAPGVKTVKEKVDKKEVTKEVPVYHAVDVTGISKGRGTTGVMKRHNYRGQRASHGVKKVHRHPGSSGQNTFPARVFKGKRMAGQYGNTQTTTRNLRVVRIDPENNLVLIRGAIPGPNGGYVVIRPSNML
jgi:large subunit ribosomal protein L3